MAPGSQTWRAPVQIWRRAPNRTRDGLGRGAHGRVGDHHDAGRRVLELRRTPRCAESAGHRRHPGDLAICPDLFWRIEPGVDITDQSEAEWKKAFELYNAFDVDLGVKDIGAAIAHIRTDRGCSGKVGAVGFCLGGLLAFLTATRTDIDASVGYYGVGIEKHVGEADKLADPLMLHIAEADQFVPKEAQKLIIASLKNHPQVDIFTYPGRDHAFARPGGEHYDAADAATANARTLALFKKALG
jgi:carboxymethylenebutenolidase